MFVYGDKLLAIGTEYRYRKTGMDTNTVVYIYDISDRSEPELKEKFRQSGYYTSARMIDNYLYLVSGYGGYYLYNYKGVIPCCGTEEDYAKVPVEDICAVDESKNDRFAVISAINVNSYEQSKKTKAILGVSENIYCNEKHLYLTGTNYEQTSDKTSIIKYSFNKTKIKLEATGSVKGYTNDQFSLDEKDGNLRIATTSSDYNTGKDKNYLFVLDENLNTIGDVSGFARDEHIEAVRYIGDMAYVITFERTDPLFIIDLSNPKAPKITGEVKIDGFSTSLTPVDENTLLGIGHYTEDNGYGGVFTNGVKLALFDISDKNNPKVIDSESFRESDSDAQYNHKAIVVNKEAGYFAIPLNGYKGENRYGALIIKADGELKTDFKDTQGDYITRCTYIGDYLYAVDDDGDEIYSFNIND